MAKNVLKQYMACADLKLYHGKTCCMDCIAVEIEDPRRNSRTCWHQSFHLRVNV
jgi:hypothetical protein